MKSTNQDPLSTAGCQSVHTPCPHPTPLFTNQQLARWYGKSLHYAIWFREDAKMHTAQQDHTYAKMARGMMRNNALNAVYYLRQITN